MLILHHKVITQEVINTDSRSTVQFMGICSGEFRYPFGFFYQYVGKTHSVYSGKNQWIRLRWQNNQLKPLIKNYLVSYREVEFTESSLIEYPWYGGRIFRDHVIYTMTAVVLALPANQYPRRWLFKIGCSRMRNVFNYLHRVSRWLCYLKQLSPQRLNKQHMNGVMLAFTESPATQPSHSHDPKIKQNYPLSEGHWFRALC